MFGGSCLLGFLSSVSKRCDLSSDQKCSLVHGCEFRNEIILIIIIIFNATVLIQPWKVAVQSSPAVSELVSPTQLSTGLWLPFLGQCHHQNCQARLVPRWLLESWTLWDQYPLLVTSLVSSSPPASSCSRLSLFHSQLAISHAILLPTSLQMSKQIRPTVFPLLKTSYLCKERYWIHELPFVNPCYFLYHFPLTTISFNYCSLHNLFRKSCTLLQSD